MEKGKRVLLVEDNPGVAKVLQFNLRSVGLDVTLHYNGAEAWDALQSGEFDAVVTDFSMPGMNGRELCQRMRQSPEHADTPVVMITGHAMEREVGDLKDKLGLAAVFAKPYSPKELVKTMQRLLEIT